MSLAFIELLFLGSSKLKMTFVSLYFLSQGLLGTVPLDLISSNHDTKRFNNSYYHSSGFTKALPYQTFLYGFLNRPDICSENYIKTKMGAKHC